MFIKKNRFEIREASLYDTRAIKKDMNCRRDRDTKVKLSTATSFFIYFM